jgi:hypothetical protein
MSRRATPLPREQGLGGLGGRRRISHVDSWIAYLATSRPRFGGRRWWFVCPRENRRVRKLYLPLGGRHFWSRDAYRLGYACQRETEYDRALRRARKLYLRLGGDPADGEHPDKPKRMRWPTYSRMMDKLVAADRLADEQLVVLAARWAASGG